MHKVGFCLPMVEAENTVHAHDVIDDIVRKHDVECHVTKLLIVAGQVGHDALVDEL